MRPPRRKRRRDATTTSLSTSVGSVIVHPPFVSDAPIDIRNEVIAIFKRRARKKKKMKRGDIARAEEQNSHCRISKSEAATRRSTWRLSRIAKVFDQRFQNERARG